MELFGIGPLELLLIVLIALIVLGPKEMMKSAQKAAAWLRKFRQSEIWSSTKEVMDIPKQVMRETGLDKEIQELQNLTKKGVSDSVWKPNPVINASPEKKPDEVEPQNSIDPALPEGKETAENKKPEDQKQQDGK